MNIPWPDPRRTRPFLLAIGLGTVGGTLFHLMHLPLAWMLGAIVANTVASMAGLSLQIPRTLRDPMVAILGVLLGSGFSMELVLSAIDWLPTIAILPLYVLIVGGVGFLYLRKVTRLDTRTAYFAAMPGGFGEMIIMGEQAGGDIRRIALMHSTRILLIVMTVPFIARHMLVDGTMPVAAATGTAFEWQLSEIAVLLGCAVLGYTIGQWIKLPGGTIVGPMILSAIAHIAGLAHTAPPFFMIAVAQLVIGSGIGARFSGFTLWEVARTLRSGLGLVLAMFGATLAVGALAHYLTGAPPLALFLALSPGGVAEMSLVALALGIEPAYVATHHIIRICLVVMMAGPAFRWLDDGRE